MKYYAQSSVEELLCLIKRGDQDAFAALLAWYENLLMAIIRAGVKDSYYVNDVYQEVCIAIFQGIKEVTREGSLDWEDSVKAWVSQIARNKCVDYRGSKLRKDVPYSDEELQQLLAEASMDKFNLEELREELTDAIAELPPIYREVAKLFYLSGKSIAEIAKMENLPEGTVKRRLHEARKKLRAYFGLS